MHRKGKYQFKGRLTAWLLLLCLGINLIPLRPGHHHKDNCAVAGSRAELDPCHASIYHPLDHARVHCTHKAHLVPNYEECGACKFQTTVVRDFYLPTAQLSLQQFHPEAGLDSFTQSFIAGVLPGTTADRGPPADISHLA
ncbi:MAG: hypothetical protein H6581_14835 [Bacteroidia bacterium]|nr:hypothetical protein [Bacteroidia bacterium]